MLLHSSQHVCADLAFPISCQHNSDFSFHQTRYSRALPELKFNDSCNVECCQEKACWFSGSLSNKLHFGTPCFQSVQRKRSIPFPVVCTFRFTNRSSFCLLHCKNPITGCSDANARHFTVLSDSKVGTSHSFLIHLMMVFLT